MIQEEWSYNQLSAIGWWEKNTALMYTVFKEMALGILQNTFCYFMFSSTEQLLIFFFNWTRLNHEFHWWASSQGGTAFYKQVKYRLAICLFYMHFLFYINNLQPKFYSKITYILILKMQVVSQQYSSCSSWIIKH